MKMEWLKRVCFLVLLLASMFVFVGKAKADSPLTSTDFHVAYKDLPTFTDKYSAYLYLLNDTNVVEKRLAVINRMGWDIDGLYRATELLTLLEDAIEAENISDVFERLSGYQLICIAYLQALDYYFDVKFAMRIADMAVAKEPDSYSVNLIAALIRAQDALEHKWGDVYLCMDRVRKNKNLNMDMCPKASAIIFEYTDEYKEYVK